MSSATATALLQDALSELPPGQNAYLFLAAFLKREIYPPVPDSFRVQLIFCSVLLAINLALVLSALVVRVVRGLQLVPFRLIKTARGTLIAPQNQMTYCLMIGVWLCLAQSFIWNGTIETSIDGGSLRGIVLIKTVSWLPLWLAALHEAWATSVMDSLSHDSHAVIAFWRAPAFINFFFPVLAIGGSVAVGAIFHLASDAFDTAFTSFEAIAASLKAEAASSNGTTPDLGQLAVLLPVVDDLLAKTNDFVQIFRVGWILWAAIATTPLFIFVPTALAHQRLLTGQISEMRRNRRDPIELEKAAFSGPSTGTGGGSTVTAPSSDAVFPKPSAEARRRRTLAGAYWRLLYTSLTIFVLTLFYTGICITIALRPEWILRKAAGVQFQALSGLYPIATVGLVVTAFVIVRCLQAAPPSAHGSHSRSRSQEGHTTARTRSQGGAAMTREQLGLRVSIPSEVIHVKKSGSPTSTLSGSGGFPYYNSDAWPSPSQVVPIRTWRAGSDPSVQVPALPRAWGPTYGSPASGSPASTSSPLPRYVPPPYPALDREKAFSGR